MNLRALNPEKLKTWIGVALAALIAYEVLGAWLNGRFRAFILVSETPSPSGRFKAVLFSEDCGTLCEWENEVSIVHAGDTADADTNLVFRSFPHGGIDKVRLAVPETDYPSWTSVKWLDDHHLLIAYDGNTDVQDRKSEATVGSLLFGRDRILVSYKAR